MKTTLFLGAGFSRAFGLPTMIEFFRYASQSDLLSDDQKRMLEDLRRRAQSATAIVDDDTANLEHVLSIAVMAGRGLGLHDDQDSDHKVTPLDSLLEILSTIYSHFPDAPLRKRGSANRISTAIKSLIGDAGNPGNELVLITTNYDLVIETGLLHNSIKPRLPDKMPAVYDSDTNSNSIYQKKDDSSPLLIKLHGSLNWELSQAGEIMVRDEISTYTFQDFDGNHRGDETVRVPKFLAHKSERHNPLIVPPTLFKSHPNSAFESIWNDARRSIQSTDKLAFIGYSFPDSDSYMKYFLANSLSDNINLEEIHIVDPQADTICERLRGDKNNYGSRFSRSLRPIVSVWENSEFRAF